MEPISKSWPHVQKVEGRRKYFFIAKDEFRAPGCAWRVTAAHSLVDCEPFPATPSLFAFFGFFYLFFLVLWRWPWHFGRMGVQHSHFLKLSPTLGRVKSSIPHGAWRFHCFPKKLAKIRVHLDHWNSWEKVNSPKIP
jgi:hypothetical protein